MRDYEATHGGSDDQGGGGYLATVSDLVAGLVFVFILMLAFFAYQLADVTENLTNEPETRRQILEDIEDRLEGQGLRVEVLYDQGVLRLSENAINFPSGEEEPVAGHRVNVGYLANAIAEVLPCYLASTEEIQVQMFNQSNVTYCTTAADPSSYSCDREQSSWLLETLLIEGHTDDVPVLPGSRYLDNRALSSMRAATVHRMIAACEPSTEGFLNTTGYPVLSTSGYGATRPIPDAESRHENRRIDLRFLLEPPQGVLEQTHPGSQLLERIRVQRQ